jgi:hypothetical protein
MLPSAAAIETWKQIEQKLPQAQRELMRCA